MKKVLALVLSLALILSAFAVVPFTVNAADDVEFAYAKTLNAMVGETIFDYDFSTDAAPSTATSGNGNTWITTSSALGKKALYFQYGNWADEGRKAEFTVGTPNFAARITVAVDNTISNSQSGRFRVYTRNSSGYVNYIDIGLPDRSSNVPKAGNVAINNKTDQSNPTNYSEVTPFTANSTIATFTFEIYNYNGVTYYCKEDGTLIGSAVHRTDFVLDDTAFLRFTCGYGEAWITEISAVKLTEMPEAPKFTYAETIDAEVGENILAYDFSKDSLSISKDSTPVSGTTWITTSSALGKKALYFTYDTIDGNRWANFKVGKENFAARITVAVDNNAANAQSGTFTVSTVGNGGTASYMKLGLPDRTSGDPYPGSVIVYNDAAQYDFDIYSKVTPFTKDSGVETFTFEVYNFNGVSYYCLEDGTLIGKSNHKSGVTLNETSSIKLSHGYGEVWVTDVEVKELKEKEKFAYAKTLNASLGDDVIDYDFSNVSLTIDKNTTPVSGTTWIQNSTALGKKALYFTYDTIDGNRWANFKVGKENFAARITVAVDNNAANAQSGTFTVSTVGNGGTASYMKIGLPDRTSGDPYPGAVTIYNESAQYGFNAYSKVTPFITDSGVETFTFEVYNFNGVSYYCLEDGTLIGKSNHKSGVTLDETSSIKLSHGYGEVWVTDVEVKELKEKEKFAYAKTLDASLGDDVIDYDFSNVSLSIDKTSTPVSGTTWIQTSTALGKKALYFTYDTTDGNRWANFKVGKSNFVARITVAVDNNAANAQSGTFVINTVGNGGTASYMKLGLPDRTSGDPYPGAVTIYNESAQYGFNTYSKVTPFTSDSGVETFTFEVYNFNGVSYYCLEDGTLIGKSNHKSGVTLDETSSIKLSHGYGEVWVTDVKVKELKDNVVLGKFNYADDINAQVGNVLTNYDFSEVSLSIDKNTTPVSGTTWIQNSTALGKKALYFTYDTTDGNRWANFKVGKENFAARITVAVDNNAANAQSGTFTVSTVGNGGTASYMKLGLPDRTSGDPYPGSVIVYNDAAQYDFDIYNKVTPFTKDSGVETFTFEVYNFGGISYYCLEDGTLIGKSNHKSGVTLNETSSIKLSHGYGEVWVTDIVICTLEDKIAETETISGKKVFKISDSVEDNQTYKVTFKYSTDSAVKLGFMVVDSEVSGSEGYVEGKDVAIYTANGNGTAEILLTVDKKGSSKNAVGEKLYMYVVGGSADDIKVSAVNYEKLTNAVGENLVANKGVSILEGISEDEEQAMRYYFSYDTTTGSDVVINGESYTVKSRGFLFANGDVMGEETVTRETAKGSSVIDMNVSTNFATCWKVQLNSDELLSSNLWYSTYVKGFDAIDGTYNNKDRLYVKGYVVVEVNGVDFTLYSEEINVTVKEVVDSIGNSTSIAQTESVTGKNRTLVWNNEFNDGTLGDMWAHYNNPPSDRNTFDKSADNVIVSGGNLTLRVTNDGDGTYTLPYDVVSRDTMAFKYGYVEIRAKVPYKKGFLPAFWLSPDQNLKESEYNGEIDIFEVFGSTDKTSSTLHIWDEEWNKLKQFDIGAKNWSFFSDPDGWHTYGLEWTETEMKFYVDGKSYASVKISSLDYDTKNCFNDFYTILLDNSVYEETVQTVNFSNVDMVVDYVRLYQLSEGELLVDYS